MWQGDSADVAVAFTNTPWPDRDASAAHVAQVTVEAPRSQYPRRTTAPGEVAGNHLCDQAKSILEQIIPALPVPGS